MPEENQNDALAQAVKRGLELAMQGGAVQTMIAQLVERSERNKDGSDGDSTVRGLGSMARQSAEIYRQRQEEKAAQEALHNAGDGISPTGSSASANLADAEQMARRALGGDPRSSVFDDRPYQIIPPSFGDFAGRPSTQSFFSMLAQRNFERAAYAGNDAQFSKYHAAGQRNASIAREIIPTAQAIGRYGQSAYRAMQGFSDVGATQIIGGVGGEVNAGPFGFRFPINEAFEQGVGIKLHQIKEAFGAGITMDQMAEIDSTMMGMGMNFNNYRFSRGEKALSHLKRYNPQMNTAMAAQLMETSMKFGTTRDLAELTKTLEGLSGTAAAANVSVEELQQQMLTYSDTSSKLGGYYKDSAANAAYLARTMPGIDPNAHLSMLQNNPLVQQQAMSMGYMPHQVGAMRPNEQSRAINRSIGESWQSITGMSLTETSNDFLQSKEGRKKLADMQTLYGYDAYSVEDLAQMVGNADLREMADTAVNKYFQTDESGQVLKRDGHALSTGALDSLFGSTRSGYSIERSAFDEAMKASNVRGNRAKKLWDDITKEEKDGTGYGVRGDMAKTKDKILEAIDAARTGNAGAPTDDWNKVLKGLEQAKQGFEALKNKQGDGSEDKK